MAVVRTVLPRKGIIQPQHGDNYEADLDANWLTLDSTLQDAADVQAAVTAAGTVQALLQDLGISGVVLGLALSTSANLTPGLSNGTLYAQGKRFSLSTPAPGAAPANSTSFLWYNSTAGFYYNTTGIAGVTGDALIGQVVTNGTSVTDVAQARKIFGQISLAPAAPGNFSVAHLLGRAPLGAVIRMTSGGTVWFQNPTDMDGTNLYLVASDAGVTAKVIVW
jgi:hypothetical protein